MTTLVARWLTVRSSDEAGSDFQEADMSSSGTLGARLYSSDSPERVGMILKIGNDFPKTAIEILKTWNMSLNVVTLENEPSTRGLLHYASDMSSMFYTNHGFQRC